MPAIEIPGLRSAERVDDLLSEAARTAPARVALRAPDATVTFAQLDAAATRWASIVAELTEAGETVAIAATLSTAAATVYYGTIRAGRVTAVVNPLLRAEGLGRVLALSRARVAVVPARMYEDLATVRPGLADLTSVILLDEPLPDGGAQLSSVARLLSRGGGVAAPTVPPDRAAPACIQFTSGTTGTPKAVVLTHHNVTVNAAQVAGAHQLDGASVLVNHLPSLHPMHLNAGVRAVATHVICAVPDPVAAIATAVRHDATHLYSLPARLTTLAGDPRLPGLRLPAARAILSGGSALPVPTAQRLAEHFGVPVVQGYGLAECSPLLHSTPIDRPRAGSVGPALPGTECRVVDLDTGQVLPPGGKGEIQVRGPQVMAGYLDGRPAAPLDQDGWLSTGDLGQLDDDGYLFLIDRLKDVFKHDNWIVAPGEIESVLLRHPAVAECVVVDRPHPVAGAVACALVVARPPVTPEALMAFVNAQVPYYQQVHDVRLVDAIPRSANGKIQRRELRPLMSAPVDAGAAHDPPTSPTDRSEPMVTFINRITVTGDETEFRSTLAGMTDHMKDQPGYLGHQLYRSRRDPQVWVEVAQWDNPEAHRHAMQNPAFGAYVTRLRTVASAEPDMFEELTGQQAATAG